MLSPDNKNPVSWTGMLSAAKKSAGLHQSHKYRAAASVKSLYCTATWGRDYIFFLLLATTINFWYGILRRGGGKMPLEEGKTNGKSGSCLQTHSLCYIGVIHLKNCIHFSKKTPKTLAYSLIAVHLHRHFCKLQHWKIYCFFPVGQNLKKKKCRLC